MGDGEMCSQLHNHAHRRHLRDPEQPQVQEYSSQGAGEQGEGSDLVGGLLRAAQGEDHPEASAGGCVRGGAGDLPTSHLCSAYPAQAVQEDPGCS